MARVIRKGVGIAVAVAGGVCVGALLGVIPSVPSARPEERPFDSRAAVTPSSPVARALPGVAADAGAAVSAEAGSDPAQQPSAELATEVEVCQAPSYGAALHVLKLSAAGDECLLVWCRGGYTLLSVAELAEGAPRVTRLGFFSTRFDAPGGVAEGDFDADGVPDLVLGVAPRPPIVHRSGAGVFFLRGRKEGGFDAPRALVETPTIALARRPLAKGDGLWVLTRGEPAAQRAGELWLFAAGAPPSRVAVLPGVVDPRDWLFAGRNDDELDLWVVAGDPGSLVRVRVRGTAEVPEARSVLSLRGVQNWVAGSTREHALLRDAESLLRVDLGSEPPTTTAFAKEVRVGPASLLDLDGDARLEVVAALPDGAAVVGESGQVSELGLPEGVAVRAVAVLHDASGRARPVLLRQPQAAGGQLSLIFPGLRVATPGLRHRLLQAPLVEAPQPMLIALE
jgi:hypothetical protein